MKIDRRLPPSTLYRALDEIIERQPSLYELGPVEMQTQQARVELGFCDGDTTKIRRQVDLPVRAKSQKDRVAWVSRVQKGRMFPGKIVAGRPGADSGR